MSDSIETNTGLNTYYVMRHGLSRPNVDGVIVSRLENGVLDESGLTPEGFAQAEESSLASGLPSDIIIVTSPFSRARQTAEALREVVGADELIVDERLGERGFGDMELGSSDLYKEVWARDRLSATHTYRGVESLCQVAQREIKAMTELEKKFAARVIVLVGHADPLNVLKAATSGVSLRTHRKAFSIKNAEIQPLPIISSR